MHCIFEIGNMIIPGLMMKQSHLFLLLCTYIVSFVLIINLGRYIIKLGADDTRVFK